MTIAPSRRGFLIGALAAPAIVRASSLMAISPVRFLPAEGLILYRGATAWTSILPGEPAWTSILPGEPGQFLMYDGESCGRWADLK